jgi:hypothetical protein
MEDKPPPPRKSPRTRPRKNSIARGHTVRYTDSRTGEELFCSVLAVDTSLGEPYSCTIRVPGGNERSVPEDKLEIVDMADMAAENMARAHQENADREGAQELANDDGLELELVGEEYERGIDTYTSGTAHSADTPWGTAKGRRQFRRVPADAKVTRRKTTLRWNTRGELMTPIEKPKR